MEFERLLELVGDELVFESALLLEGKVIRTMSGCKTALVFTG